VVLKDANFHERGMILNFGPNRGWFVEQITRDIRFLRAHGIVDFSLLVGIQPKHHERSGPQNLAELVSSIKRLERPFKGRLHVSESAYESPYDSVHNSYANRI
jgi:hypothetical protein